ncbi:MAG: hypothetical protein J1F64_08085, partial [Oscillospiraceae bacterium]|nr:hypothetical protein [Oscillospiraceae bacterium]
PCDGAGKKFVTSKYFNHDHSYWAYSPEYINSILYAHDMRIADIHYFHILSALIYSFTYNENFSVKFSGTDRFLEHFDFAKKHSANVILTAVKGDKQNEKHS